MADGLAGELEVRASESGPRIHAVILQEGRASTGHRHELFAAGAVQWPAEGIVLLVRHHGEPGALALPSREPDGRIVVAPATPALFAAVHAGKRFASVEFFALEERTARRAFGEVQRALVTGATVTDRPENDSTAAEIRERPRCGCGCEVTDAQATDGARTAVDNCAPGAPTDVRDAAVALVVRSILDTPYDNDGQFAAQQVSTHNLGANLIHRCGAASLLAPWRRARARVIQEAPV